MERIFSASDRRAEDEIKINGAKEKITAEFVLEQGGSWRATARGATFLAGDPRRTATWKQSACSKQAPTRTMNKEQLLFMFS
jgi:hypothetical protein